MSGPGVLIVTLDTLGSRMAGPAIRAWEIARHLSKTHEVLLLHQGASDLEPAGFRTEQISRSSLSDGLAMSGVVICQGFALHLYPELVSEDRVLVIDLYDPFHLECLEMNKAEPWERREALALSDLAVVNEQLRVGDFFICASEKQRDFWLGQLAALGRVNNFNYDRDRSLRRLIDVVPFGIPDHPPSRNNSVLKGKWPGIAPSDKVLLWGGGIYNWFDPLTVIRAVDKLRRSRDDVKLFFLGSGHPNPEVPTMRMAAEARALSRELGLQERSVFFNEDWVPYRDRADFLLESDIGVSSHFDHVETRFSYRTRVLDYFWGGLPVIATEGDALSDLVEARGLGITVREGDPDGFAEAVTRLVDDPELRERCKNNIATLRPSLVWSRALAPLEDFLADPGKAPDFPSASRSAPGMDLPAKPGVWKLPGRVWHYWRKGGWELVRVHTRKYLSSRSRSG